MNFGKKGISILLFFVLTLCTFSGLEAQDDLSLEQCIEILKQNNPVLKISSLGVDRAEQQQLSAKAGKLPTAFFNFDFGNNTGRNIDPTSNDFVTTNLYYNSLGINLSMPLYNGNRLNNDVKKGNLGISQSKHQQEQDLRNMALQVANLYLGILLAEENIVTSEQRLANLDQQREGINSRVKVGQLPEGELYIIEAQIASISAQLMRSEADLMKQKANLAALLQIDPDFNLVPESRIQVQLDDDLQPIVESLETIYEESVSNYPALKAQDDKIGMALLDEKISRSTKLPQVSLGTGLRSNFSSIAAQPVFGVSTITLPVRIDGELASLELPQTSVTGTEEISYLDQLDQNRSLALNLGVSVPLYNRGNQKVQESLSALSTRSAQLERENLVNEFYREVLGVYYDAQAAYSNYQANLVTVESASLSYEYVSKKYDAGSESSIGLRQAETELFEARQNLLISKYQFLFNKIILDFYSGKIDITSF